MRKTQPAGPLPSSDSPGHPSGKARLLTVIAAAPGLYERSLRTVLESLPSIRIVGSATGCLTGLQMVRERQAHLVVIDASLPLEEVQELLRQLRQDGRETRCLVLADTSSQVYRALALGVDAALRRDTSTRQLRAAILELQQAHSGTAHGSKDESPSGGQMQVTP